MAIGRQQIVARLTEGLLIKDLAREIKMDTRTLATFIKNPNDKFKKNKGGIRNLSAQGLRKIHVGSYSQPKQHQCTHFYKGWNHTKDQTCPMQCAKWDGTEHQTYSKASTESNVQKNDWLRHRNKFPTFTGEARATVRGKTDGPKFGTWLELLHHADIVFKRKVVAYCFEWESLGISYAAHSVCQRLWNLLVMLHCLSRWVFIALAR